MRVGELVIYPLKSTTGHAVPTATVQSWGFEGDRRWMLVDPAGDFVTARRWSALLAITATSLGEGRLRLEGPHAAPVEVDATTGGRLVPVRVWRSRLLATHVPSPADAWASALVERDVRLVWLDDPTRRPTNPEHSRPEDRVTFADGYPMHLTTTASLRQLNDWVTESALERGAMDPEPLVMRRFRPNIVVDQDKPFAEDEWRRLRIGSVEFRMAKRCQRCVLTTVEPRTRHRGPEPLRALATHRRSDGKMWFGVNLIPDGTGEIQLGDDIVVLD